MTSPRPFILLALALTLVAVSCGSSGETTTTAEATTTTTVAEATTSTTAAPPTGTDQAATTTTPTTTTTLAGTPIDFFPQPGDELSVVGVAHDDVLNVRVGPGIFNDIVDTLEPTDTTTATGNARDLGSSIWVEHDTGDTVGWSNFVFLAFAGAADDATAEVVGLLGEVPTADSMAALGRIVADSLASTDPRSRIVMTVEPTGDLTEVTYDVIGLGDDAVFGYRLRIFGEEVTDGFSLDTVERTALCGRGVTADGLCV
ncbi:MAG: hypothetical protein BMS9Abin07_1583 [Acidimicrobiia bacterium]|nr:MAG: hypothetical protein BMS9Abin07_1583 [Acidimicrobiia bacterium]